MLLRQLEYFCTVVEQESFTRAAANWNVSQSAVSQAVHALESELGVELLAREGRSFSVRPTGALVARRGRAVLQSVDAMEREVRELEFDLPTHVLVGYSSSYRGTELAHALAAFVRSHPRVTVEALLGSHDYLLELLHRGAIDLAFSTKRRGAPSTLVQTSVGQGRVWVEASESSPYAWAPELSPMQLVDAPVIALASPRTEHLERDYLVHDLGFAGDFLFVRTLEEGRMLVAANRGVLISVAASRTDGEVGISRQVPLVDDTGQIHTTLSCYWPEGRANPFLEEFALVLREMFMGDQAVLASA